MSPDGSGQVGDDYPVWIKLGVAGLGEGALLLGDGAKAAAACAEYGIDCVEISHALGIPDYLDMKAEAPYLGMAEAVRQAVGPDYPLALVSGFRTRVGMEKAWDSGVVQMVSLCRPFIAEPELVGKLASGESDAVLCVRCDRCRARTPQEWLNALACRNDRVQEKRTPKA